MHQNTCYLVINFIRTTEALYVPAQDVFLPFQITLHLGMQRLPAIKCQPLFPYSAIVAGLCFNAAGCKSYKSSWTRKHLLQRKLRKSVFAPTLQKTVGKAHLTQSFAGTQSCTVPRADCCQVKVWIWKVTSTLHLCPVTVTHTHTWPPQSNFSKLHFLNMLPVKLAVVTWCS